METNEITYENLDDLRKIANDNGIENSGRKGENRLIEELNEKDIQVKKIEVLDGESGASELPEIPKAPINEQEIGTHDIDELKKLKAEHDEALKILNELQEKEKDAKEKVKELSRSMEKHKQPEPKMTDLLHAKKVAARATKKQPLDPAAIERNIMRKLKGKNNFKP